MIVVYKSCVVCLYIWVNWFSFFGENGFISLFLDWICIVVCGDGLMVGGKFVSDLDSVYGLDSVGFFEMSFCKCVFIVIRVVILGGGESLG